jgi:hypothetical protein
MGWEDDGILKRYKVRCKVCGSVYETDELRDEEFCSEDCFHDYEFCNEPKEVEE